MQITHIYFLNMHYEEKYFFKSIVSQKHKALQFLL